MRLRLPSATFAFLCFALAPAAAAQSLVCPPAASVSSHTCEAFHFHVALYRPDTRGTLELSGINQFASQAACERARETAVRRNAAVTTFLRQRDDRYQVDVFGPCHCDLTVDKASPNYLTDTQRLAQLHQAEDVRQRVRERLLDAGQASDSELVRSLAPPPAAPAVLGGAKVVSLPSAVATGTITNDATDLRMTKLTEAPQSAGASMNLPLVDVPIPGMTPPEPPAVAAIAALPAPTKPAAAPAPAAALPEEHVVMEGAAAVAPAPAAAPATPPIAPTAVVAAPTSVPTPTLPAAPPAPTPPPAPAEAAPLPAGDEVADAFVQYETERIQSVLTASSAIGDESVKTKIFETCMQRLQLLSTLRSLIQGSGANSRLATAARDAKNESERLALVAALFGGDMPAHWAPHDAKDVVVESSAAGDAEKILRDATGRYAAEQKKHALYIVLAHTQPSEEQQLWLGSVIEGFLK
jgi:hypothetical protein